MFLCCFALLHITINLTTEKKYSDPNLNVPFQKFQKMHFFFKWLKNSFVMDFRLLRGAIFVFFGRSFLDFSHCIYYPYLFVCDKLLTVFLSLLVKRNKNKSEYFNGFQYLLGIYQLLPNCGLQNISEISYLSKGVSNLVINWNVLGYLLFLSEISYF